MRTPGSWCVVLAAALVCACGPRSGGGPSEPAPRPTGPLDLDQAREYVLSLVNRDRAEQGLPPVERDEAAEKAGQRHAEDMVRHGFTAHWGSDGSVPEQRYTDAGGVHLAQENAACFFDGKERELDPNPMFEPELLEQIETAFISEKPPHDGHRKNILKPVHNRLGVGLAKPVGIPQPCMAQEFVDAYGDYDGLPERARIGQTIEVSGEVHEPVEFGGVGISRIDLAEPTPAKELNKTSTYAMPHPYVMYFPPGFKTPKPVRVSGRSFSIEVALSDGRKPGRYGVSVWGKYPDSGDALVMVSLRTIDVK